MASVLSSSGGCPATLAGLNSTHSSDPKDSISFKVLFSCFRLAISQTQVLTRQLGRDEQSLPAQDDVAILPVAALLNRIEHTFFVLRQTLLVSGNESYVGEATNGEDFRDCNANAWAGAEDE